MRREKFAQKYSIFIKIPIAIECCASPKFDQREEKSPYIPIAHPHSSFLSNSWCSELVKTGQIANIETSRQAIKPG